MVKSARDWLIVFGIVIDLCRTMGSLLQALTSAQIDIAKPIELLNASRAVGSCGC